MGMDDFNLDDDEEKKPLGIEDFQMDDDAEQPSEAPLAEESSNRTFLIIAAALGGIALVALVCIAVYALVLWPRAQAAQDFAPGDLGGTEHRSSCDHRQHFHLSSRDSHGFPVHCYTHPNLARRRRPLPPPARRRLWRSRLPLSLPLPACRRMQPQLPCIPRCKPMPRYTQPR